MYRERLRGNIVKLEGEHTAFYRNHPLVGKRPKVVNLFDTTTHRGVMAELEIDGAYAGFERAANLVVVEEGWVTELTDSNKEYKVENGQVYSRKKSWCS